MLSNSMAPFTLPLIVVGIRTRPVTETVSPWVNCRIGLVTRIGGSVMTSGVCFRSMGDATMFSEYRRLPLVN